MRSSHYSEGPQFSRKVVTGTMSVRVLLIKPVTEST